MFNNIGEKIKGLAKFVCWMGIFSSVVTSFSMMANKSTQGGPIIGIIVLIVGCLLSWVGSFFTYGFGELISRAASINVKSEQGNPVYHKDVYENETVYQETETNMNQERKTRVHEEGKCDICGAEVAGGNTYERLYHDVNYSVCSECANLLDIVNDEWTTGNKRNKALNELRNRFEK